MNRYEQGTITGAMKLDMKSLNWSRIYVCYTGLSYKPAIIDEKWDGGSFQNVASGPRQDIGINGNWTQNAIGSTYPLVDGGDGKKQYTIAARFITRYNFGIYKLIKDEDSREILETYYWYDEETPDAEYIIEQDSADHIISKIEKAYELTGNTSSDLESGAWQDDNGNYWVTITEPAEEGDENDYGYAYENPEGSGQWWIDSYRIAEYVTTYEVEYVKYTYKLQQVGKNWTEENPTLPSQEVENTETFDPREVIFYPSPKKFEFKYQLTNGEKRLYPDKGITSLITNFFEFYSYASQFIAWFKQEESSCPRAPSDEKYLTANHLNEVMQFINNDFSLEPYSSGQKITLAIFTDDLMGSVNSGLE